MSVKNRYLYRSGVWSTRRPNSKGHNTQTDRQTETSRQNQHSTNKQTDRVVVAACRMHCLLVACLTSQQQASVSRGRICSDNSTCCHTEIEVADPTFHLTQSQYTDTGPTSPSADPITPGAWQGSHWSAQFLSHWYDSTPKKSRCKRDSNPGPSALDTDALPLGQREGQGRGGGGETDRQTGRHTDRQRDRETQKERETETETERQRETDRDRERERERESLN